MSLRPKIKGVKHVGYFVTDLEATLAMFRRMFDLTDDDLRVMSADQTAGTGEFGFVNLGATELELIQLIGDQARQLCGDPPPGISHIAIQVEDIEAVVEAMAQRGFRLGYITKHGIFDNGRAKVAYLEPADTQGHLIELVEPRT